MKIGFDARMISHPGIGRYIKNIIAAMLELDRADSFSLFGKPEELGDFPLGQIIPYQENIYTLKELFLNPFGKYNLDILHIPHFNAPLKKPSKLVVTIHDLIYLKNPDSAVFYKRFAAQKIIMNTLRIADRIIAVSENTKKDIIRLFPSAEGKIQVIYEAAGPEFKKVEEQEKLKTSSIVYGLSDKFILFVGSLKKHKNIEGLIDAFLKLKKQGIRHQLVIVGRYHPQEPEILQKIKASGALYLGEVDDSDLINIYNLAELLVLPSFYEGFGLPVLEAMACQTPVIASNVSSLPEVVENPKFLFDPKNIDEMARKIYLLLTDPALRNECLQNGERVVTKFNWRNVGEKTLNVYRELMNNEKLA